jgi:hypothetical protein
VRFSRCIFTVGGAFEIQPAGWHRKKLRTLPNPEGKVEAFRDPTTQIHLTGVSRPFKARETAFKKLPSILEAITIEAKAVIHSQSARITPP